MFRAFPLKLMSMFQDKSSPLLDGSHDAPEEQEGGASWWDGLHS